VLILQVMNINLVQAGSIVPVEYAENPAL